MSGTNLEDNLPVVRRHGLNTDEAADLDSTLNVEGAVTLQSTAAITGAVTATGGVVGDVTGNVTGGITLPFETKASGDETILATDSGKVFIATASSGTQTFTLPAVAAGLWYTFICGHADGEILIDQAASEVITVTTFAAVGADADTAIVAPAGGTGIKNTAATNAVGDSIQLVSDGTGWYGVGISSGIWASQ